MASNFNALNLDLENEEIEKLRTLNNGIRRYRDPDNHGFGNQQFKLNNPKVEI